MAQKPVYLTSQGFAELEAELAHLRNVKRQEVAARIASAKELSNPDHNAEYDDARNERAFVEGRILTLENLLKNAVVIDETASTADTVSLGSTVTLIDEQGGEQAYTIVGSAEAHPKLGKISNESPVGRALLGRKVGEEVQVLVPAGVTKLIIKEIH